MNTEAFKTTLSENHPPQGIDIFLKALWFDAKGAWEKAHELVQDEPGKNAALIHAYLHRREGDIWNADYWYRKAGTKRPDASLEEEWQALVTNYLAKSQV